MKYLVRYTEEAAKQIKDIARFSIDHASSKQYIQRIIDRAERLSDFPYMGIEIKNRVLSFIDLRYLIAANHIIYYKIYEKAKLVRILGVKSQTSNWKAIINKDLPTIEKALISNETLAIREMDRSMYYDVWKNSLDSDNRKYCPDEVFETLEEAADVVNQIIENYQSENGPFVYSIIRNQDKSVIGFVQLTKFEDKWLIGYHIAKRFSSKGYATNALLLFMDYIRENMNIKNLHAKVSSLNKASVRVLEKCGFSLDSSQGKEIKASKILEP